MESHIDLSQMEVKDSYARLLNHIPGAVYRAQIQGTRHTFSKDYKVQLKFASRGIYKLLDISSDKLRYNANMMDAMILREDWPEMREKVVASFLEQRPYKLMYRMRLHDGTIKWVLDQGEVVCDEPHNLLFMEGIMMDFSEYKNYELALKAENKRLHQTRHKGYGFANMVGTSEPMRTMYAQLEKAAESDSSVLLLGETGTGKEVCAKTIHDLSGRTGAFVPVNCGAIPEQLMESEFFGHVKGAFSGAVSNRDGFVQAAHNGTLFLDEIGELPLHLQVKLLRTLENKQFTPVGSTTPQHSTFRLVAATHQDLAKMVKNKTMRSDFYYRINVLPITVPPLRERDGDIPLLIASFMEEHNITENIPLSLRIAMEHYSWPGNIRELRNFLERFFRFGDVSIDELYEEQIFDPDSPDSNMTLEEALKRVEYKMIWQAMEKCRWKQSAAADLLGLNLRTFQRKLKYHNISR